MPGYDEHYIAQFHGCVFSQILRTRSERIQQPLQILVSLRSSSLSFSLSAVSLRRVAESVFGKSGQSRPDHPPRRRCSIGRGVRDGEGGRVDGRYRPAAAAPASWPRCRCRGIADRAVEAVHIARSRSNTADTGVWAGDLAEAATRHRSVRLTNASLRVIMGWRSFFGMFIGRINLHERAKVPGPFGALLRRGPSLRSYNAHRRRLMGRASSGSAAIVLAGLYLCIRAKQASVIVPLWANRSRFPGAVFRIVNRYTCPYRNVAPAISELFCTTRQCR